MQIKRFYIYSRRTLPRRVKILLRIHANVFPRATLISILVQRNTVTIARSSGLPSIVSVRPFDDAANINPHRDYAFKHIAMPFAYLVSERAANLPFGLSTFASNAFSCSSRSAFPTKTDRALILLYSSQFCAFVRTVLRFVTAKGDNT